MLTEEVIPEQQGPNGYVAVFVACGTQDICLPAGADSVHWIGNRSGPVPDAELLSLLKEVELSGAAPPPFAHNAGSRHLAF
jgi:hypothetical protein